MNEVQDFGGRGPYVEILLYAIASAAVEKDGHFEAINKPNDSVHEYAARKTHARPLHR